MLDNMRFACDDGVMVMIQVRDVPGDLHRALKARAVSEGVSLSELIRRELPRIASRPSMETWLAGLAASDPIDWPDGAPSPTALIREDRDRG